MDELLLRLRRGEIQGLNVTIPHKQSVLARLDGLGPAAQAIGAVSVIYRQGERLVGENMDAPGFITALQSFWQDAYSRNLPGASQMAQALILGAGGSARAVAYALLLAGWHVTLASRRVEQAAEIVLDLQVATSGQQRLQAVELSAAGIAGLLHGIDLLVNTTPLGMWPAVETTPWPVELALPANAAVYDLVYNPSQTALVRLARLAGLLAASGSGMLIEQAILAFELWTGVPASRDTMSHALAEIMEGAES